MHVSRRSHIVLTPFSYSGRRADGRSDSLSAGIDRRRGRHLRRCWRLWRCNFFRRLVRCGLAGFCLPRRRRLYYRRTGCNGVDGHDALPSDSLSILQVCHLFKHSACGRAGLWRRNPAAGGARDQAATSAARRAVSLISSGASAGGWYSTGTEISTVVPACGLPVIEHLPPSRLMRSSIPTSPKEPILLRLLGRRPTPLSLMVMLSVPWHCRSSIRTRLALECCTILLSDSCSTRKKAVAQ